MSSNPPSGAVLVPVKAFDKAKGRLGAALDADDRAELARSMATHVVQAQDRVPVAIACDDPDVAEWATSLGAEVVWVPGTDLNGAVAAGVEQLAARGTAEIAIAHSDLPLAGSLERFFGWPGVTVVPDRHRGGTNVLVVPADCGFEFAYGVGSYRRHVVEAVRLRRGLRIVHDRALGWDIDHPDDLRNLEGQAAAAVETTLEPFRQKASSGR